TQTRTRLTLFNSARTTVVRQPWAPHRTGVASAGPPDQPAERHHDGSADTSNRGQNERNSTLGRTGASWKRSVMTMSITLTVTVVVLFSSCSTLAARTNADLTTTNSVDDRARTSES